MSQGSVLSRSARVGVSLRFAAIVFAVLATAALLPSGHGAAASGDGGPRIYLQEGRDLAVRYAGPAGPVRLLESGQAEPLSLTEGDFHGDGVAGLAVGYATADGNVLAVHEGNLDAFAPRGRSSWEAIRDGNFPPPFLPRARVLAAPARPDFLQAGAFAGQAWLDLVTAARGGRTLYLLPGEGHGSFGPPVAIRLPGAVTALAAGRFGAAGPFTSLLVAVSHAGGSSLLLYQGSRLGLQPAGTFALPAPATQLAFGDLDGDALPDAAVVAGGDVFILHAAAAEQAPALQPASLPLSVSALALGRFLFDRGPHLQMALLAADGGIHIAAHAGLDARPWSPAEVGAMLAQRGRPSPILSSRAAAAAAGQEAWNVVESFAGTAPFGDPAQPPLLLRGNLSSRGADDVVVLDGEAGRMAVVSHPNLSPGAAAFGPGALSVLGYPSGKPVAALAARVGAEARPGLVVLHQGRTSPSINMPLPDPTFTVNTTADTVDAHPGDGICADSQGNCSLRAAVMEANATLGNDTIMVPAGTFTLTIPNNFQYNATGGHLDVDDGLTIVGAGQGSTIIQAGTTAANGIDKVFSIAAPLANGSLGPSFATSISNLTIQFGLNTDTNDPFGGAFDWDAGANGNGSISITSCTIQSNSAASSQSSLDDGGGMFFSNEAGNTGTVAISNSIVQGNSAQDAGGGLFVGTAVPLTLSNVQVLSNKALGAGAQQGGGLAVFGPSGANQSALHNSRVSANQVGAQGGGIWATAGLLIDQGTVVTGNSSSGTGGGLWTAATNETTTIADATFTANSATGAGGGIQADSSTGNTVNLSFSRIVGNTASAGTGLNNVAATVSATDDWWGCNGGPGASGCDSAAGAAATSPWLVLTASGNPASIIVGNSTTVTASLLVDSQNNVIAASNLAALAPIPVTWSNPLHCTLANPQANIASGTATATCTGSSAGPGALTAAIDNASATASFAVTDFSMSISPTTKNAVVNGGSAVYTVTATPGNNFCGTVTPGVIGFAVRGKPNLANVSFNPATITISCSAPAAASTQLTVTTTSTTPIQAIPFTATGSSGNPLQTRNSQQATLNVTDFSISLSPSSQQLVVGGSVSYTLQVSPVNGFSGTVNITSCGIAPLGAGVTLTGCPGSLTIPSPASATLTVSATLSATLQPYTISVTGKSGDAPLDSHGASATATTTDFSLSISPASETVVSGTNGSFLVTVSPLNGFTGQVNISCSWSPTGPGTQGCPTSVTITSGAASFTLTPGTGGIALQTYTLTVTGTSAAAPAGHHSATAQLTVQPLILRPTAFNAFSTPGYSSPANAADGNAGTFSGGPVTAGILNEEDWFGFSTISGTPTQVLLKVTSAANCVSSSNDGVEIQYSKDGTHNNDTLIYQLGLFAGVAPQPRSLQTDVITLPTTQNPANVRVLALVYSQSSTSCHQVYDTWLEIKF